MTDKKLSDKELTYNRTAIEKDHVLGVLVEERNEDLRIERAIDIPVGYKRPVLIDDKEEIAFLSIGIPGVISPEFWYPVLEWRLTTERLSEADMHPQWKRDKVVVDGLEVMEQGRNITIHYYVLIVEQDMSEEADGFFFVDPPFSREEVKMSDIGLPMIKGSDILALQEAKKLLGNQIGTALRRQRVGE